MLYPTTTLTSSAEFKDSTGALFDPTTVQCTIVSPSGDSTAYIYGSHANLTKASTGSYSCVWDATESGNWYVRWYGQDAAGKVTSETVLVLAQVH